MTEKTALRSAPRIPPQLISLFTPQGLLDVPAGTTLRCCHHSQEPGDASCSITLSSTRPPYPSSHLVLVIFLALLSPQSQYIDCTHLLSGFVLLDSLNLTTGLARACSSLRVGHHPFPINLILLHTHVHAETLFIEVYSIGHATTHSLLF